MGTPGNPTRTGFIPPRRTRCVSGACSHSHPGRRGPPRDAQRCLCDPVAPFVYLIVAKTIVICCDGTGNSDTGVASNVKRLSELVLRDATQVTKYHRGVGTAARPAGESRLAYWPRHLAELAFGDGIDETLAELYDWLSSTHEQDDRVFLFGFSRGAFTLRALAGMVHLFGLLKPNQHATAPDVVRSYAESEARIIAERRRLRLPAAFGPCEIDHAA